MTIKMKVNKTKLLGLLLMLACVFGLTACGSGETKTLKQWCDIFEMDYLNVKGAYHRGLHSFEWLVEKYKNHGSIRKKRKI
jgi:hypothetical protein